MLYQRNSHACEKEKNISIRPAGAGHIGCSRGQGGKKEMSANDSSSLSLSLSLSLYIYIYILTLLRLLSLLSPSSLSRLLVSFLSIGVFHIKEKRKPPSMKT